MKEAMFYESTDSFKMSLDSHPLEVRIVVERMEQVVVNLVKNAVEAMEEAGTIAMRGVVFLDQQ